jgi:hypothetical protein
MPDQEPLSTSRDKCVRWLNTLQIVVLNEDMMYVITSPLPSQPPPHDMSIKPIKAFNDEEGVKTLLLACMDKELSDLFDIRCPHEVIDYLKRMFHH